MSDMISEYIGKECLIYTMNSQLTGVITRISDGWMSVDNGKETEAVNLDFVVRVRLYPRSKSGKKKSIVTD